MKGAPPALSMSSLNPPDSACGSAQDQDMMRGHSIFFVMRDEENYKIPGETREEAETVEEGIVVE